MWMDRMAMDSNFDRVSYLTARDPTIISLTRTNIKKYRCNLIQLLNDTVVMQNNDQLENNSQVDNFMRIFLRLRGGVVVSHLYNIENNTFTCEVPHSHLPKQFKEDDVLHKKYSFSQIFNSDASQTEIFDTMVKPKIFDLINGHNSSLLAYGASGSGKTHTIVGTESNPGVIPRALEYLFRSLPTLDGIPKVQAMEGGFIKRLSVDDQLHAQEVKVHLTDYFDKMPKAHIHKKTYRLMQQRISEQPTATVDFESSDVAVAVWISFVEIYNENIYDLLQPHTKNRPKLSLCVRKNTAPYVKGLTSIFVYTGLEAYQILRYGLTNLNFATTSVNDHSSRSHCIFTIKLVQFCGETSDGYISTFNFCDLAGSERLKKTNNVGDRLKETNNINTSLFVLGRCIKEVRDSQKRKDNRTIPFRDSKLTQLFQHAISGHENLSMIVNVNPSEYMYPETQQVLNFSAIAMEVKIVHKAKDKLDDIAEEDIANQRILDLEELLENMQEQVNQLEEERHKDITYNIKILRQQSERMQQRWRDRFDEQVRIHQEELLLLQIKYGVREHDDSVVEVIDSDDEDNDHLKCRIQINNLKAALKESKVQCIRMEAELNAEKENAHIEKRESTKLMERVIELEDEVDFNITYNNSLRLVYSDDEMTVDSVEDVPTLETDTKNSSGLND